MEILRELKDSNYDIAAVEDKIRLLRKKRLQTFRLICCRWLEMAFVQFTQRHKNIKIMTKTEKKIGKGRGAKTKTLEVPLEVDNQCCYSPLDRMGAS